jgi:uncharacterized protein
LVCEEEALAALDRQLDRVFRAALSGASDEKRSFLRAEQRGWIKGRDECWKAERERSSVFLTESWSVTGLRACVEASYRFRISELQAAWRLVPAEGPFRYECDGRQANRVEATFFATDPPTASLERDGRSVMAWLVPTGSGSRYEGRNVTFWAQGDEARVTWVDEEFRCRVGER